MDVIHFTEGAADPLNTFAAKGVRTAVVDLNADAAEAKAKEIGNGAIAFPCDVSDPGSVKKAVDGAVTELGGLDILVNSAGVVFLAPAETQLGHCHPTGAWCMQSVQMGLSQWPHTTEAARSGWFTHGGALIGCRRAARPGPAAPPARDR